MAFNPGSCVTQTVWGVLLGMKDSISAKNAANKTK